MKNASKVTFVILGAIIGAGFISGQEINLFFNKYNENGIIGILFSGILIGIIINKTYKIIYTEKINTYEDLINKIIPIKNKYIKLILNNIVSIFLLLSFFIMASAFNSFFKQEFQIPIYITGIINCLICFNIFIKENKLIIKINQLLMPIIIISIFILILKTNINFNFNEFKINIELLKAFFSGLIYSSYNIILLIPIMVTLNKYINNNKQINKLSIISSTIIIELAIIIYFLIDNIPNKNNLEIPLIYLTNNLGKYYYYIYSLIILLAIFTTQISVGYGFLRNITKSKKSHKIMSIIICIISVLISNFGFSNLVNILYPVFGIFGLIEIIFLLIY